MKSFFKVLSVVIGLMASDAFGAGLWGSSKLTVPNSERTLSVIGPIGENALKLADQVERLSAKSSDPIYIIINSPGGAVLAGSQLAQAMDIARARDVKVVCAVGNMAASMAFQLLPHCTERYALRNSLLLFHPSRVSIFLGSITSKQALSLYADMKKIDDRDLIEIERMMKPRSKEWLLLHFEEETMWFASDLVSETNGSWLNIVDAIDAPSGIFNLGSKKDDVEALKQKASEKEPGTNKSKSYFIILN